MITVIREPDDVTILCKGRSTTFTCVLDGSISSGDVQWYRILKDTGTTGIVDPNDYRITILAYSGYTSSSLTITNTRKSYAGYYWIRLPSDDVCNVSLTVLDGESM